jgi:hypothetical protein
VFTAWCHVADWCNRLAEVWTWPPLSSSFTEAVTTITVWELYDTTSYTDFVAWVVSGSCVGMCFKLMLVLCYPVKGQWLLHVPPGLALQSPLNGNAASFLYSTNWNFEYCLHEQEACGLENREYSSRDPSCWPRGTLYLQKLALTSPTSGGRSVSTVHSRTQATEFGKGHPSGSKQFVIRKACNLQVASHKWHRFVYLK